MIKVLPFKGPDSYWALQTYIKLLFGLKMLPMYMGETLDEFFGKIEQMNQDDRKKIVRQSVIMVTLDRDELNSLVRFAADPNGVPYSQENLAKMDPNQIMEILHAVTQELAALEPHFLSASEKKN